MKESSFNILVTGGSGFLGSAIVNELLRADAPFISERVRVFDVKPFDEVADPRIESMTGDIRNLDEVDEACRGIDIVIHAAAIIDWGTKSEAEVYAVNYTGTENVINACLQKNVSSLVYISSLDAVYTGKPLVNIDESQAYPDHHPNMYCKSKALAEQLVASSHCKSLRTCILRPSDIWGENDPYHIGSLINMAKTGFYVRLGNGESKCQHIYSGNMAHAIILAAKALVEGNKKIYANKYFITDGDGANFFKFFDKIIIDIGYKIWPKNLWLPRWLAYSMGAISEFIAILIRPIKYYNPKLSRFAVTYTCTDFTFTSEKALHDFGFKPKYSHKEAIKRTVSFYKN